MYINKFKLCEVLPQGEMPTVRYFPREKMADLRYFPREDPVIISSSIHISLNTITNESTKCKTLGALAKFACLATGSEAIATELVIY